MVKKNICPIEYIKISVVLFIFFSLEFCRDIHNEIF